MRVAHIVKTLDAHYEESSGTLMLFSLLESVGERRIIAFNKDDFHFNGHPVPDQEMHKTAALWKGKRWTFIMDDDPNADPAIKNDDDYRAYEKVYMGDVGAKMMKVAEEMNSDNWKMQHNMERLLEKEREARKKLDAAKDIPEF